MLQASLKYLHRRSIIDISVRQQEINLLWLHIQLAKRHTVLQFRRQLQTLLSNPNNHHQALMPSEGGINSRGYWRITLVSNSRTPQVHRARLQVKPRLRQVKPNQRQASTRCHCNNITRRQDIYLQLTMSKMIKTMHQRDNMSTRSREVSITTTNVEGDVVVHQERVFITTHAAMDQICQ